MVECRIRKRNGEYLWITGIPSGLLNIVRDISDRKLAEKKLQDAYRAVEELAVTDALTGLANRRRFDQCLATEWRRGMRSHNPLSVLLVDVDLFKSYNDRYGHLSGDACLRLIAETARSVITRPGDLIARFGGEEFAVILPNTLNEGAAAVAVGLCDALRERRLQHEGNPLGVITVSVGCATITPQFGQHAASLVDIADQALYKAKRGGRNQVCNSALESSTQERGKSIPIRSDSTTLAS